MTARFCQSIGSFKSSEGNDAMPILVCQCGQTLSVKDEHVGKMVRCPACGHQLLVAAGADEPPAPAPRRPRDEDIQAERPAPRRRRDADDQDDAEDQPVHRGPLRTSGLAVASLVFGGLSLCVPCVLALPGLIFGIVSLVQISKPGSGLKGKGLAISGIIA